MSRCPKCNKMGTHAVYCALCRTYGPYARPTLYYIATRAEGYYGNCRDRYLTFQLCTNMKIHKCLKNVRVALKLSDATLTITLSANYVHLAKYYAGKQRYNQLSF